MASVLSVRDLSVNYGDDQAIEGLNLNIEAGRLTMLLGESGSGKSTFIRSILGLLGSGGNVVQGEIMFNGIPLPLENEREMRAIRGKDIAIILQNPDLFLNPLLSIQAQYHEALSAHSPTSKRNSKQMAMAVLSKLGFTSPENVLKMRPFELSGGMCQRAAIAIAMANTPQLLLADEPTSALDVASQRDVMELLKSIQKDYGTTILLVTHNMSIVAHYADEVGIMYHGHLIEWGSCEEVLKDPKHNYTKMLLNSVPRLGGCLSTTGRSKNGVMIPGTDLQYVNEHHCYMAARGG